MHRTGDASSRGRRRALEKSDGPGIIYTNMLYGRLEESRKSLKLDDETVPLGAGQKSSMAHAMDADRETHVYVCRMASWCVGKTVDVSSQLRFNLDGGCRFTPKYDVRRIVNSREGAPSLSAPSSFSTNNYVSPGHYYCQRRVETRAPPKLLPKACRAIFTIATFAQRQRNIDIETPRTRTHTHPAATSWRGLKYPAHG